MTRPMADPDPDGKWRLSWGIHNGTFTSRDMGDPRRCDSREEALAAPAKIRRDFERAGWVIWFATLYAPDGACEHLGGNSDYNNDVPFSQQRGRRDAWG